MGGVSEETTIRSLGRCLQDLRQAFDNPGNFLGCGSSDSPVVSLHRECPDLDDVNPGLYRRLYRSMLRRQGKPGFVSKQMARIQRILVEGNGE